MNFGNRKILKNSLKKELKKGNDFFKITKTNKRNNINNTSCDHCSTSYFSKCNNKCSI